MITAPYDSYIPRRNILQCHPKQGCTLRSPFVSMDLRRVYLSLDSTTAASLPAESSSVNHISNNSLKNKKNKSKYAFHLVIMANGLIWGHLNLFLCIGQGSVYRSGLPPFPRQLIKDLKGWLLLTSSQNIAMEPSTCFPWLSPGKISIQSWSL